MNPRLTRLLLPSIDAGTQTRIRAAAGTGIRPPDGFEHRLHGQPVAQAGAQPERRSRRRSVIRRRTRAGRSDVVLNTFDDLIVAVGRFSGSSRYRTDNISNARARGLELATTLPPAPGAVDLQARVTYTFLDSEILSVDRRRHRAAAVPRRPAAAPAATEPVGDGCERDARTMDRVDEERRAGPGARG